MVAPSAKPSQAPSRRLGGVGGGGGSAPLNVFGGEARRGGGAPQRPLRSPEPYRAQPPPVARRYGGEPPPTRRGPPGGGGGGGGGRGGGGGGGRGSGSIISYVADKSYGFIKCGDRREDVYFHKSLLPNHMQNMRSNELSGIKVDFTFVVKEDGKARADRLFIAEGGGNGRRNGGGPPAAGGDREQGGDGKRLRRRGKAGGARHRRPPRGEQQHPNQDGEGGSDGEAAASGDDFEDDFGDDPPPGKRARTGQAPWSGGRGGDDQKGVAELDSSTVDEMTAFLEEKDGVMDYGRFSNRFAGLKKNQVAPYFDIIPEVPGQFGGRCQIMIKGVEPLTIEEREARDAAEREQQEQEKAAADAAAVTTPLAPSATLRLPGIIRKWSTKTLRGVVAVTGWEDLPVEEAQLPSELVGSGLNLNGYEVTCMLETAEDGSLVAVEVHALLQPDGSGGWQLKRA